MMSTNARTIAFVTGLIERSDRWNAHPVWKTVKPLIDNGENVTLVHHSQDATRRDDHERFVLGWPDLIMSDKIGLPCWKVAASGHRVRSIRYESHDWGKFDRIISFRQLPTALIDKLSTPATRLIDLSKDNDPETVEYLELMEQL